MSLAQKSRKASKPRRRYRWPSNLELQVLLWELKQADIASAVGCRQTAVSARAQELGFDTPTPQYWRLKKAGFDVAAMVPESVKQARIALQKLAALAGEQGSSPAQPDNVLALPGTPDDGLVLQAVEPGVTCVSNIS